MKSLRELLDALRGAASTFDEMQREKAVELLQWEHDELRHVFALLVLGNAVGLPAPPVELGLGLLPDMEDDLRLLVQRLDTAHSPLSRLVSSLRVD